MNINSTRLRKLNNISYQGGNVAYWMSRDQRVEDNWALLYAQQIATNSKSKLSIVFCLQDNFLSANTSIFNFMIKGLEEVEKTARKYNIPFTILIGKPKEVLQKYCHDNFVDMLVTDFSPLKISRKWKNEIASRASFSLVEVDTHNIVPIWVTSEKAEYSARTIRPKILKLLESYLVEFPKLIIHPYNSHQKTNNWSNIHKLFSTKSIYTSLKHQPGESSARKQLNQFINNSLTLYEKYKNDPTKNALSNLSVYLHFGMISSQRIVLEINKNNKQSQIFFEELIIRKELSDNYCFYNLNYDNFNGFPLWAQKTLNHHRGDKRDYLYSQKEFENAQTHDSIWNACQMEMLKKGKMHGYMRMYWAKKILEWSSSPEEAQSIAIYLNDKYELDGRDPNGYTGIAWSIGGVHDRPWFERNVFGTIRYMNENGLRRKFDVDAYIKYAKNL